jgi:ribosomal protein L32
MTSCDSCGGKVDANETVCPYCGSSIRKRVGADIGEKTYLLRQDADGLTHVRFGDGVQGRKPSTGTGIRAGYRSGGGSAGNVATGLVMKFEELYHQVRKVPDPKKGGSKDMGIVLVEALANMGDILSFYQDGIANEAQLDTDDRKRLSKMEKRVTPKLKDLIRFCEKASPRALGQLGVSNSDIGKIKTAAIRILKMTETSVCSKCGTMNRPENRRCKRCGKSL